MLSAMALEGRCARLPRLCAFQSQDCVLGSNGRSSCSDAGSWVCRRISLRHSTLYTAHTQAAEDAVHGASPYDTALL